jgi:hypothetical protein
MHWSQRVRDQQAARANVPPTPYPSVPSVRPSAKPRATRPKPPKDEDAEYLLRLCRDGRLFEVQAWVAAGKSLAVPPHYRQTPLRVALDTGFHSLIEFLLQHETEQAAKDEVVSQACWKSQYAVMELALRYGASIHAVSFQDVIETWNRDLALRFLERGADPVTNAPFARAFKQRIKGELGIFLDCKRARPDLADDLQEQADIALRQACQDDDVKWVSLLMWLGANPRSKGLTTDDLDTPGAQEDPSYHQSALQIACGSRKPEILRRLKPDPAIDDLRELVAAASSFSTTPETVAYLISLGADINDQPSGGSTALDSCLRQFGWRESVLDAPYPYYQRATVPVARLTGSLDALRSLLARGARWIPAGPSISDVRKALYRLDAQAVAAVVDLLRGSTACDDEILKELVRTPKMRSLLAAAKRSADAQIDPKGRSRRR